MAIAVADHREMLERILQDHGLRAENFEVVPDVQAWCHDHGVEERNPNRQAKCFLKHDGTCHIVMLDVLTDDLIAGGKDGMLVRWSDWTLMSSTWPTSCCTRSLATFCAQRNRRHATSGHLSASHAMPSNSALDRR